MSRDKRFEDTTLKSETMRSDRNIRASFVKDKDHENKELFHIFIDSDPDMAPGPGTTAKMELEPIRTLQGVMAPVLLYSISLPENLVTIDRPAAQELFDGMVGAGFVVTPPKESV